MDIMENWTALMKRTRLAGNARGQQILRDINQTIIEELDYNIANITVGGEPLISAWDRLGAAGLVQLGVLAGQQRITGAPGKKGPFSKEFTLTEGDGYAACCFPVVAAVLEELDGAYDEERCGKMDVLIRYTSPQGRKSRVRVVFSALEELFPWVKISFGK